MGSKPDPEHDRKVAARLPEIALLVTVAEPLPAIEHAAKPGTLPVGTANVKES